MVKKLKRLVLAWCVLFIAGMSFSGAQTFAKAKSFKRSETEMSSCLHNTPMNLDKNDNINYYQIEEKVDKQEKYYWQIHIPGMLQSLKNMDLCSQARECLLI